MATRTNTTSRSKLTKTDVKRSAPIEQIGGEGGWIAVPYSSPLGLQLIEQRKKAKIAFDALDEGGSLIRACRADEAMDAFADALSYIPPKGAIEALVATLLISGDLDMAINGSTEHLRCAAQQAAGRRIAGVAQWIERTCKIDKQDFGFIGADFLSRLVPHAATVLNVNSDQDS
ncbi:hypothetical protein BN961_02917 [Afipia felis]|uniref:Uncharacterized protein n=1 Tax=Afipia felis TaxID=1035 RepID=A0A090MQ53_AFIFE|nr:hypothetical protein [Afipia felis]CEG09491.1 hypothetical protein BN961_02917 [Afipia felis]